MFLKPTVTRVAAREYEFDFRYSSRPSWEVYNSLLEFADVVRDVASGATDLSPLIGAPVDLDGLPAAFAEHAAGTRHELRTLFVR